MSSKSILDQSAVIGKTRKFLKEDVDKILNKIFSQFDKDKNNCFSKTEFPKVLKTLTGLIGADEPLEDDVEDLFTLLDINGDENINRQEFGSLLWTFFQILEKQGISLAIKGETDLII